MIRLLILLGCASVLLSASPVHGAPDPSFEDEQFLRRIQKDTFRYFINFSDPDTGLTHDSSQRSSPCSIAATGFSLVAWVIGQEQGWISYREAYDRVLLTLETLDRKAQHRNGFFYHFLDPKTGRRAWGSEASSIDTALLVAGALFAGEYYKGTPVEKLAKKIYRRVNWEWMRNGSDLVCMGWKPESGFLPYYWDSYNELMILQALAIGSPTFPVPAEAWNQWNRFEEEYNGKQIIYSHSGSLFTYQYAQAFIDFRELNDAGVNYFENSRLATIANREFCIEHAEKFRTYSQSSWGLTASLGPFGYKAYGALPGQALHDGTLAPSGSAASIVFTPSESIAALKFFYSAYAEKLYGEYGFKDAFNVDRDWWAPEYLGIDQGITVMMIENYLTEGVWRHFMNLAPIQKWAELCKLQERKEPAPAFAG
ncbi:MAG: hypothetical protein HY714_00690 [Candidatus Omnitrophica bacterium]|nr:hypothetical protein [Candidatus Omnitrophota bacterium]